VFGPGNKLNQDWTEDELIDRLQNKSEEITAELSLVE